MAAKKAKKKPAKKKVAKKKPAKKKVAKKKPAKKKKVAKKKPAKKKVAKKKPAKKKQAKTKRKPNAAFMRPVKPDAALAAVIGATPVPRTQVVKKLWAYVKNNGLQDKRNIKADAKLKPLFGKSVVTMFELAKIISKHVS